MTVSVLWLFLTVSWVGLQWVIVVFFFIILTCLFTTDSEWDCVAAVKLIPVLLYIVDYTCISLSFGTMASIVEL